MSSKAMLAPCAGTRAGRLALGVEVVAVVAVQRVPDDDEAVDDELEGHGAFDRARRRLRAWPMPSSCLPAAMAVSIGQRCA